MPTKRERLSREARRDSGNTTLRVSHAVAAEIQSIEIPRKPFARSAGASTDDKLAFLLLAPRLSAETIELLPLADDVDARRRRKSKKTRRGK